MHVLAERRRESDDDDKQRQATNATAAPGRSLGEMRTNANAPRARNRYYKLIVT